MSETIMKMLFGMLGKGTKVKFYCENKRLIVRAKDKAKAYSFDEIEKFVNDKT